MTETKQLQHGGPENADAIKANSGRSIDEDNALPMGAAVVVKIKGYQPITGKITGRTKLINGPRLYDVTTDAGKVMQSVKADLVSLVPAT